MNLQSLETIATALLADGKGILAADETVGTLTKRFEQLKIPSTAESRRDYRELLFTTPGSADFISGVIMYDETIRQQASNNKRLIDIVLNQGIIAGIKVDTGAKPLAGFEDETVTEGLDGLRDRLKDYRAIGAQFAKWRAVIRITDELPSQFWRPGWATGKIMGLLNRLIIIGPDAMRLRARASILRQWRMSLLAKS